MDSNQIITFSEDTLNRLFEDTPEGTVNANVLDNTSKDVKAGDKIPTFTQHDNTGDAIPTIDLDKLDVTDDVVDDKKDTPADTKDTTKDTPPVDNTNVETAEHKLALKNTVDYYVEAGLWKDFQGRDELKEVDSETFAKLAAAQDAERLQDRFSELVDSTGDYGKAIINHIKNGGNPEEVIDLFKEQKELQAFDKTTEQGKLDYIFTYYSEILGLEEDKIKSLIDNTILKAENKDEALGKEVKAVEAKFQNYYQKQLDSINKQQEEIKKDNEEKQKVFVNNIKDALTKDEFFTEAERKVIQKSITEFKHKLPNGAVVNDFYVKFAEKQKDPAEYARLVNFILDREAYETKIAQKKDTKVVEKKWDFIKANAGVKKNITPDNRLPEEDKDSKLDFSRIFNRK